MKPVNCTPTQKPLKGSRTEANLVASYMAESAAYTRYTFYAQQAEKEGYHQVADIFNETAGNELHHGKIFFKYLPDGAEVNVTLAVPAGVIGYTSDNLAEAAREEETEGVEAYKSAAIVAREEGYPDVADHFEAIATIELHHRQRFLALKKEIDEGTMWKREKPIKWQCRVCGYIFEGTEPPAKCPACNHPSQYYEPMEDNY